MPIIRRAALALVAAIAAGALAGCGGASTPSAQGLGPNLATIFQDQPHILSNPTGTLDTFRSLGVTDVRISMGWSSLAPNPTSRTPPSGFDATSPTAYPAAQWAPYDAAVRAAAARGIGVYFLLTGPGPVWATTPAPPGTPTHKPGVYEPSPSQFGAFVKAAGTRYDGHYTPPGSSSPLPAVRFWSIWDEPNYGYQLAPQALGTVEVSPYIYRGLVGSAWSALKASGHGTNTDTILIGETAPRGAKVPGIANGMLPLRFLRALYCVDASDRELRGAAAAARHCPTTAAASQQFRAQNPALFDASGFAVHLYTPGQVGRPDLATPANEPDSAGLADLRSIEGALDRLRGIYGATAQLPIFNTEFGFQTNPPLSTCGCVFLSPSSAAYYLNWAEYIEWRDRRVHSDAQYLLYDAPGPAGRTNESGFSSGLVFLNGTPKPGYAAFRLPMYLPTASVRHGRALSVWGYVRPAAYAQHDTGSVPPVEIQFEPGSRGPWTTVRTVTVTGSASAFDVPIRFGGSGSVRLRWTYPSGFADLPPGPRTVTSRVERITVR